MTPAQEGARLKATLDGIWAKGDRDECSVKHIGHGLAAIVTGGTWENCVDYGPGITAMLTICTAASRGKLT